MSNKMIGLALLAAGVVLIIFGLSASDSIGSDFSRLFTGTPTDKSVWMLVGGVVLTALGAFTTFRRAGKA